MSNHDDDRREILRGLPIRLPRRTRERRRPEHKLRLKQIDGVGSVLPTRVRVDVAGGRHGTAAALRAQRVAREIEETGGRAAITEVGSDRSRLVAEVDGAQASSLARHRFIRLIETLG